MVRHHSLELPMRYHKSIPLLLSLSELPARRITCVMNQISFPAKSEILSTKKNFPAEGKDYPAKKNILLKKYYPV